MLTHPIHRPAQSAQARRHGGGLEALTVAISELAVERQGEASGVLKIAGFLLRLELPPD